LKGVVNTTDLGINVQLYPTCGIVKVNSITKGVPIKNAKVSIYKGRKNIDDTINNRKLIIEGKTDKNGIFYYTLPEIPFEEKNDEVINTREDFFRFLVIVKKGDDWTYKYIDSSEVKLIERSKRRYLTTRYHPFMTNWSFGDNEDLYYSGIAWSDRYLYKVGDTVKIKGVIGYYRYEKFYPLKNAKLQIQIRGYPYHEDKKKEAEIITNDFGTFTLELPTDETWQTTEYEVLALKELNKKDYLRDDNKIYISLGFVFRIAEFRVPQCNITLESPQISQKKGTIRIGYRATYFDGTPMVNIRSKLEISQGACWFSFPEWEDFEFLIKRANNKIILEEEANLDSNGFYSKLIPYDTSVKYPITYNIIASVKIENGEEVRTSKEIDFYPIKKLIGIRFSRYYKYEGDSLKADIIVVDTAGNPVVNTLLKVAIIKTEEAIKIEIRDNGCGFDPEAYLKPEEGNMQYGTIP
ncbi:MAG: hypothetical protein N2053_12850, partial [Chitinispirillaceae bacterium]|nr:hypothetical protein [Chitinispirillaceae bacterium]